MEKIIWVHSIKTNFFNEKKNDSGKRKRQGIFFLSHELDGGDVDLARQLDPKCPTFYLLAVIK